MASGLFQDQNLIDHVNGAGTIPRKAEFTGPGKAKVGGRKPLGDLSNAVKPMKQVDGKKALNNGSVNTVSKSLKSKNTPDINNEAVSGKAKKVGSSKRTASKATENSHTGGRKALSDISNNSGKPRVPETTNKSNLKSSLCLSAIDEELIFHNHEECIKSQIERMDMHHFFKTVGLEDESNDHLEIPIEVAAHSKLKYENEYLELEEVPEHLPEVPSLSEHGSPTHCKSPRCTMWDDEFTPNFKLIETPKLSKK